MFDSPFDHCPRCGEIVLLDQTLKECAREHGCADTADCPLRKLFCGRDFSTQSTKRTTGTKDTRGLVKEEHDGR